MAALALIVILIDAVFVNRQKLKQWMHDGTRIKFKNCFLFVLPILLVLLSKVSWSWYLDYTNTIIQNNSRLSLLSLLKIFSSDIPENQLVGILEFVRRATSILPFTNNTKNSVKVLEYSFNISFLLWAVLFLVGMYFIRRYLMKKSILQSKRNKYASIACVIGFLIYALTLLFSYLFLFAEWETRTVAAFDRYMSTYALAMLVFLVYTFMDKLKLENISIKSQRMLCTLLVALMLFGNVFSVMNITISAPYDILRTQRLRQDYSGVRYNGGNDIFDLDDKVYIVTQETNSYEVGLCIYEVTPIASNAYAGNKLTAKEDIEKDKNYTIISCQEFSDKLAEEYTYVYLYQYDAEFIDSYQSLFENVEAIQNNTLYSVFKTQELVHLVRVDR